MSDKKAESAGSAGRQELLEKYCIRHVPADVFYYRDYRYGKLEDAVAQAMRDQGPAKSV